MALTQVPAFPQAPFHCEVQIVNADASNLKTLYTGASNGSRVRALQAASDDTGAKVIEVGILVGATFFALGAIFIPVAAGTDGATPAVDLFNSTIMPGLPVDEYGMHYVDLKSGEVLQAKVINPVTAGKTIHLNGFGQDW